jgi:hypothetical protein
MRISTIALWLKERRRSSFLIGIALVLVVIVALLATLPNDQGGLFRIFAKNLFIELLGAVTVAIIAGVFYERLFTKTIIDQIAIHQEKSMSKVSRLVYQLEETTVAISDAKTRMIELLDKGTSATSNEKSELHEILARIPRWAKDYPEIHFYVAQLRARIGNYPKAIDSLRIVINDEDAYKYCVNQGQGERISELYQAYQLQLETIKGNP